MLPTIFLFFFNFRIISKSILHNHSNSIRKLNYDRRKWANTFLFFFFSSWLFFLGVELCYFFFFFSFHAFLFFFFWGCAVLLFSVLDISFWGRRICSSCFWSLFLASYFLGPCVFSLSPLIAWTSRSEIDSSLFLATSLIVFVEPW